MEAGGKSPFGNADLKGYVKWVKTTASNKTKTTYSMSLTDTGKHGLTTDNNASPAPKEVAENLISRGNVSTKLSAESADAPTAATGETITECKLN